jgi:hypothetical protein
LTVFDQAMEILEIQPDLQDVVLNADKKLSVQLRVGCFANANQLCMPWEFGPSMHARASLVTGIPVLPAPAADDDVVGYACMQQQLPAAPQSSACSAAATCLCNTTQLSLPLKMLSYCSPTAAFAGALLQVPMDSGEVEM